jgi:hypothetical protein
VPRHGGVAQWSSQLNLSEDRAFNPHKGVKLEYIGQNTVQCCSAYLGRVVMYVCNVLLRMSASPNIVYLLKNRALTTVSPVAGPGFEERKKENGPRISSSIRRSWVRLLSAISAPCNFVVAVYI